MGRSIWNRETRARLADLAAKGLTARQIAAELGTTEGSVFTYAGRQQIDIPAEIEARRKRERARERVKRQQKAQRKRARVALSAPSKTSPEYRRCLPVVTEVSKSELRSILTQAVLNTGGRL